MIKNIVKAILVIVIYILLFKNNNISPRTPNDGDVVSVRKALDTVIDKGCLV